MFWIQKCLKYKEHLKFSELEERILHLNAQNPPCGSKVMRRSVKVLFSILNCQDLPSCQSRSAFLPRGGLIYSIKFKNIN